MPRKWIAIAIAVVLTLLVADVVTASVANRRVADAFTTSQRLTTRPYVHINGWPFVLQALRGSYGYVTVQADPARTSGAASLDVHPLRLSVRDMHSRGGFGVITIERAAGTARIGYRSLSKASGRRLAYASATRITTTVRIRVAGRTYRPTVSARPRISDDTLVLSDIEVTDQRKLPDSALPALQRLAAEPIDLGRFPFGVHPTSVRLNPEAMTFKVSARDVTIKQ